MDEKLKELNAKEQERENQTNHGSDEEYAEKMYDEDAPTPPQFDDPHEVSHSGSELKEER